MKLTWLGHSCFRVEADGCAIVIDPYADGTVPGLRPLRPTANEVLASHGHDDHGAVDIVRIVPAKSPSPFRVTKILTAHDDQDGALRGPNVIHVLEAKGEDSLRNPSMAPDSSNQRRRCEVRAAHLGDLGHMLTAAQIDAIGPLDALMIPIGGYYTIDAQTAKAVVDALAPTVVLPMHYRSDAFGFDVIDTADAFLRLMDPVTRYDGDAIEIVKGMPRQTAVLTYQ